jgi:RNA polymerase sigma-70 factor, ECF subfamily
MMAMSDSLQTGELLKQVQDGNPRAVDDLLARHREALRRMIALRLDHAVAARVDASDVTQDVMLEAARRLAEYVADPRLPFQLWLRQIAQDRLIDAHRRHRRALRRSVDREEMSPADESASAVWAGALIDRELTPATALLRKEMEARFEQALAALDTESREMIMMRHFERLSNQEVATALELSEAAASMRYLRAVRKLREVLLPDAAGDANV